MRHFCDYIQIFGKKTRILDKFTPICASDDLDVSQVSSIPIGKRSELLIDTCIILSLIQLKKDGELTNKLSIVTTNPRINLNDYQNLLVSFNRGCFTINRGAVNYYNKNIHTLALNVTTRPIS
jgi:hypothetical protein